MPGRACACPAECLAGLGQCLPSTFPNSGADCWLAPTPTSCNSFRELWVAVAGRVYVACEPCWRHVGVGVWSTAWTLALSPSASPNGSKQEMSR